METPKKILFIDDDDTSRFLAQRVFKKVGIEAGVLTVSHGLEALIIVKEVCQREQCPELILIDIGMLVMDGFEFLEALQKSVDLSSAPIKIVLVSSSTPQLDLVRTKKYPVIDCIEKPLTPEKLAKYLG